MSALATVTARSRGIERVTPESLLAVARWVESAASPEELAWEHGKFRELRDYLKTQQAAKELRIQAVRLECIALRRIGRAGLSDKLRNPFDRKAAAWFGDQDDARFTAILAETENTSGPVSVMNHYTAQAQRLSSWFGDREWRKVHDEAGHEDTDYQLGIAAAVHTVLGEIVRDGEPIEVADAANRVFEALVDSHGWHDEHLPVEIAGEPLREVVRRVLRSPGPASRVLVGEAEMVIPAYVTYQPADGEVWQRVPWERAVLWQLKQMVELRTAQAEQMRVAAENMAALYAVLEDATGRTDSVAVADLIAYADVTERPASRAS